MSNSDLIEPKQTSALRKLIVVLGIVVSAILFVAKPIIDQVIQDHWKGFACRPFPSVEYFCGKPDAKPEKNNPPAPAATSTGPAYR
jgi:hypothetical protein